MVHANQGYRRFVDALRDGELTMGATITQNALCAKLSMSLSPLRETLVLLEEHGLVEVRPRAGIRIVEPNLAFIRDNYQFRMIIELHAVRVFAETVTADWIAEMRRLHAEAAQSLGSDMPREAAPGGLGLVDHRFHRSMVEALGNAAILATHDRLQLNIGLAQIAHTRPLTRKAFTRAVEQHLAIMDRLEAGDVSGAVEALEAHFQTSAYQALVAS